MSIPERVAEVSDGNTWQCFSRCCVGLMSPARVHTMVALLWRNEPCGGMGLSWAQACSCDTRKEQAIGLDIACAKLRSKTSSNEGLLRTLYAEPEQAWISAWVSLIPLLASRTNLTDELLSSE